MNPLDFYDMPITHSLVGTAGFAVGFAILIAFLTRNAVAAVWAAVASTPILLSEKAGGDRPSR